MTWEVAYRKAGQFRILFATIEGENELTARVNFHQKFDNVFIKTICQKEKETALQAPLDLPKQSTEKKENVGMS